MVSAATFSRNSRRRCATASRSPSGSRKSIGCSRGSMQATPDYSSFAAAYAAGRPVLVWTSLVSDLETPVSAMLKLADGRPNSFLFESVEGVATRGLYSFIGFTPYLHCHPFGNPPEINRRARSGPDPACAARAACAMPCERLAETLAEFERNLPSRGEAAETTAELPAPDGNMTRAQCMDMVERAKEYIRAGEIFQVVPSMRFSLPFRLPPFALYRALRRLNPSPFLFFLDFGDFSVVGSSPEILVRLRDGTVTIRPLAGTRRRGATAAEARQLAEELLADPKELAEHLMLLDLARNDVGRVAEIGTVRVTEKMVIH